MATTREARVYRLEDWEGNIYTPEGATGGSGSGGSIGVNPDDIGTGGDTNFTEGTHTGDSNTTTGTSIIIASGGTDKVGLSVSFSDISFGFYSVGIRAKLNTVPANVNVFKVEYWHIDDTETNPAVKIGEKYINTSQFAAANQYTEVGCLIEYKGTFSTMKSLKINIIMLKNTNITASLDVVNLYKVQAFDVVLDDVSINAPQTKIVKKYIDNAINAVKNTVSSLTARMGTAETNITNNRNNISNLTSRMGTAENNITTNRNNITTLTNKTNASNLATNHTHAAGKITGGTFAGQMVANANNVKNLGTKQIRNIQIGTSAPGSLPAGDIYIQY